MDNAFPLKVLGYKSIAVFKQGDNAELPNITSRWLAPNTVRNLLQLT